MRAVLATPRRRTLRAAAPKCPTSTRPKTTLEGNALLKARALSDATGLAGDRRRHGTVRRRARGPTRGSQRALRRRAGELRRQRDESCCANSTAWRPRRARRAFASVIAVDVSRRHVVVGRGCARRDAFSMRREVTGALATTPSSTRSATATHRWRETDREREERPFAPRSRAARASPKARLQISQLHEDVHP